jgi:ectoine hydroxylase-related dioxygenase (phytanoyl-CoA dioxygenase family)
VAPRPLAPIAFRTSSSAVTYRLDADGSVTDQPGLGADAATIVALSEAAWADLTGQLRTFINLQLSGELTYERGSFEQLAEWDPYLRLVHAGIPIFDPARVDLGSVDLTRRYTLDDSDDELRAFLLTTGYLHVRDVFDGDEMAAANAEVDRLAALAAPGDDQSWWAVDADGGERVCRLVYATQRSDVLAALERDERVTRLGTLLRADGRRASDRMEGSGVILKLPGPTTGLANIPWHQDCGMGGHGVLCPNASVGVQLTGSSRATGNLTVVPGSHGQTLPYTWERRFEGVPIVEVDSAPGDVTVHIADVMHASPEPTGAGGRRTLYVTFYPPALWDHVGPGEAFNDVLRNRTAEAAALRRS